LRSLQSLAARPLDGTARAFFPFWSPDGRQLAFFADLKLRKLSIAGGRPEVLCDALDPRGASWGKNGDIVFAPVATGPLCRVSAEGGAVTVIQRPDSTLQETALRWPQFLPDGKHFMFVALPPRDGNFDVYVASLDAPGRKRIMSAGAAPTCAGEHGLIFASSGRIMCQKFDYRRLETVGEPIALGPATSSDVSVGQHLAIASLNGVLVQPSEDLSRTELVWLDRAGRRQGIVPVPEGRYERLHFAPDGRRLLAERRDSPTTVDLWLIEIDRGHARRITERSQSRIGGTPVFSPDGSRIAFSSNRAGRTGIYQRRVDGAREEEFLHASSGQFNEVFSWSPDGQYLIFGRADPLTQWDLWLLPLEGKREPIPYLRTRFSENSGVVSPDGRWMAYSTDVTGKVEVYVRSFPTAGAEILASNAAGNGAWATASDELIILRTDDRMVYSVPVSTASTFGVGKPKALFRARQDVLWITSTPAGDRFLAAIPAGTVEPATITVDLNWPAQVGR
jgi:Tol biopolymer transport system component